MSQYLPPGPSGSEVPGQAPGGKKFPGELNHTARPDVLKGVPNAGTAPRSGRVADEAFVRALYAEHGGALLRYALHLTGGDRQRAEDRGDLLPGLFGGRSRRYAGDTGGNGEVPHVLRA